MHNNQTKIYGHILSLTLAPATAPMDLAGWPALSNGESSWAPVPLPEHQSDHKDLNIKKFSKWSQVTDASNSLPLREDAVETFYNIFIMELPELLQTHTPHSVLCSQLQTEFGQCSGSHTVFSVLLVFPSLHWTYFEQHNMNWMAAGQDQVDRSWSDCLAETGVGSGKGPICMYR